MPSFCVVPLCSNYGGHLFPKNEDVRNQWIKAINKPEWKPGKYSVVCKAHFKSTDYNIGEALLGERSILKRTAVPSIFPVIKATSKAAHSRKERLKRKLNENNKDALPFTAADYNDDCNVAPENVNDTNKEKNGENVEAARDVRDYEMVPIILEERNVRIDTRSDNAVFNVSQVCEIVYSDEGSEDESVIAKSDDYLPSTLDTSHTPTILLCLKQ